MHSKKLTFISDQLWTCHDLGLGVNFRDLIISKKDSILKHPEKYMEIAEYLGATNIQEIIDVLTKKELHIGTTIS